MKAIRALASLVLALGFALLPPANAAIVSTRAKSNTLTSGLNDNPDVALAVENGKRLWEWISFLNTKRPADQAIRLSSLAHRGAFPIEAPEITNLHSIQAQNLMAARMAPQIFQRVLLQKNPFTDLGDLSLESFVVAAKRFDLAYEAAVRFKFDSDNLSAYQAQEFRDVRGFYFLQKNHWDEENLSRLELEPESTQMQVEGWLRGICLNSEKTKIVCAQELSQAKRDHRVAGFYHQYQEIAQTLWKSFFTIQTPSLAHSVNWGYSDHETVVYFKDVGSEKIRNFLQQNIEDEWKKAGWNIRLKFGFYPNGVSVNFEPGTVPNVNGEGGNTITLDANASLDEFETQWTIRHEFGHILGFPDCYVEFYDEQSESFINYQLDTSDIMCSYAGNFKESHYTELKRAYEWSDIFKLQLDRWKPKWPVENKIAPNE